MFFLFALTAAMAWPAIAQQPAGGENPVAGDPQAIEEGRKAYAASCAGCHGITGEGARGPNLRDGRLIRRSSDAQMFRTIQKGIAGTDMPGSNLPERKLWELVAFVRGLGSPAAFVIHPGDPAQGERIYSAQGCANCHAIRGVGGASAPDLSNIGATRSYEHLRESILKPAERITPGYQPVTVRTQDGRTLRGALKSYSNYDVQFTDAQGKLYIFPMAQVSDVQLAMTTAMPANYATRIARQDIIHLLAYLSHLTLRPVDLNKTKGAARR